MGAVDEKTLLDRQGRGGGLRATGMLTGTSPRGSPTSLWPFYLFFICLKNITSSVFFLAEFAVVSVLLGMHANSFVSSTYISKTTQSIPVVGVLKNEANCWCTFAATKPLFYTHPEEIEIKDLSDVQRLFAQFGLRSFVTLLFNNREDNEHTRAFFVQHSSYLEKFIHDRQANRNPYLARQFYFI